MCSFDCSWSSIFLFLFFSLCYAAILNVSFLYVASQHLAKMDQLQCNNNCSNLSCCFFSRTKPECCENKLPHFHSLVHYKWYISPTNGAICCIYNMNRICLETASVRYLPDITIVCVIWWSVSHILLRWSNWREVYLLCSVASPFWPWDKLSPIIYQIIYQE